MVLMQGNLNVRLLSSITLTEVFSTLNPFFMCSDWDEHGGGVYVFRRAPSLWSFFKSLMKNFDASKAKGQTNDFFVIISRV